MSCVVRKKTPLRIVDWMKYSSIVEESQGKL